MSKRLPVTVITGFLGAGKTTLLRHLLMKGEQRLAVIVNEFGSIGLDGDLIRSCGFCAEDELDDRLVELNNGCLCCTVQDDFLPTMDMLLSRSNHLDGIVIETSGLALPRPLLQALEWPDIRTKVYVNGVVTVVDGEALSNGSPVADISTLEEQRIEDQSLDHLTPVEELFTDQLEAADLVLISRSDCVDSSDLEKIKVQLSGKVREGTPILPISHGQVDPSVILGLKHESLLFDHEDEEHDHDHVEISSGNIRLEGPVSKEMMEEILPELVCNFQVIRLKGRCWIPGKSLPLQIQMVGPRLSSWFEKAPETAWKPDQSGGIDFVLLSFRSDALETIRARILSRFAK